MQVHMSEDDLTERTDGRKGMNEYQAGSIVLGKYIITGTDSDFGIDNQYPCIGPTGGKNTVLLYNCSENKADALEKQMNAWKALSHPGVLTPLAHGWETGRFIVVVEQDLSKLLPLSDKRFDVKFDLAGDDAPNGMNAFGGLTLLAESAELLGYIASQGFVHGCVSPVNLLYGDGCIYLNGFTLLSGRYIPAYCSMEQMCGRALTPKTDVYSWAVSVLELYLGKCPWSNGVVAGLNCTEYLEQAERTRGIPEGMRPLLERCLDMEPEGRPDWTEIVEALRGWLDEWYLPWKDVVKIASDSDATVIESAGYTIKGDFSETRYLAPKEEAAPQGITTPDGKYRIGRQIEFDPPFDIYEANEIKSGKTVTLLRLDPNSRNNKAAKEALFKRYVNSIIAAADDELTESLHTCENIVIWCDMSCCWDDTNIQYLIADAPYGQSLFAWAKGNVPLGENLALYLIGHLLTALHSAHARGLKYMGQGDFMGGGTGPALVHMSVSPENIRIIERGKESPLLLLDGFDTALPAKEKSEAQYCGAPAFSSRWQVINASYPDPAWDVWAAAACLYYLLTGKYPRDLSGNIWDALLSNKTMPIRERRPDIAPELAAVIDRALDDSRGLYYANVDALWDDLLAVMKADDEDEEHETDEAE